MKGNRIEKEQDVKGRKARVGRKGSVRGMRSEAVWLRMRAEVREYSSYRLNGLNSWIDWIDWIEQVCLNSCLSIGLHLSLLLSVGTR